MQKITSSSFDGVRFESKILEVNNNFFLSEATASVLGGDFVIPRFEKPVFFPDSLH